MTTDLLLNLLFGKDFALLSLNLPLRWDRIRQLGKDFQQTGIAARGVARRLRYDVRESVARPAKLEQTAPGILLDGSRTRSRSSCPHEGHKVFISKGEEKSKIEHAVGRHPGVFPAWR